MTILRLQFAGFIVKADHKTAGAKQLIEMSLCKKNYAKDGDEATFTWCRVCLWEPPAWMAPKLVKGAFVAGSGEMTLRSYAKKDGTNGVSCDVRCTSWDIECGTPKDERPTTQVSAPVAAAATGSPAASVDEPPF